MMITIIMPTFRRPHTLPRAIASVQAQTHGDWELWVIDNAGDVTSVPADPRIRLARHPERTGAAFARNVGIGYATGEAVCFVDDDDEALANYLEVFDTAFRMNPSAKLVRSRMRVPNGDIFDSLATPVCCVRREFATPTWDNHGYAQDQRYWASILDRNPWKGGVDVVLLDDVTYQVHHSEVGGLRSGAL